MRTLALALLLAVSFLEAQIKVIQPSDSVRDSRQTINDNFAQIGPGVLSASYDFAPQSPGGSLAPGGNTVTLRPVPAGVNGTDTAHYLYISGGTGTPEACLTTGGTAVSGAASGTVILSCAGSHSGAWTVRSATAGMQEAVNALPSATGLVKLPAGTLTVYAPVTVAAPGVVIAGAGGAATTVSDLGPSGDTFAFTGDWASLTGLSITASGKTGGWAVDHQNGRNFTVADVNATGTWAGINLTACTICRISGATIRNITRQSIYISGGNDEYLSDIVTDNSPLAWAGLEIADNGGVWAVNCDFIHSTYGVLIDPGAGQEVNWTFFTSVATDTGGTGFALQPQATGIIKGFRCDTCWASSNTGDGVFIADGMGLLNIVDIRFSGLRAIHNARTGFHALRAVNVSLTDSSFAGNSYAASGTYPDILVEDTLNYYVLTGNHFAVVNPSGFSPSYNIQIASAAVSGIVTGNDFLGGAAGGLDDNSTSARRVVKDNIGDGVPTVASASVLDPGATDPETVNITGSAAVTAISRPWDGRTLTFVKNDAGTVSLLGVNISIGGSVSCTYVQGLMGWFCH